jgi:glycine/D-amino acid oxidase-like deaminating enzyme
MLTPAGDRRLPDVVVIGAGVAGSAVATALCHSGHEVSLLFRGHHEGSSFTNQKWNHSGLLYPAESIARKACREFVQESALSNFVYKTRFRARFLALHQRTLDERKRLWFGWDVRAWGLNWRELHEEEFRQIGPLGETRAIGGFEVPDRIVDFPGLVRHLRQELIQHGGKLIPDANVERICIEDKRVTAVELLNGQERLRLKCALCVLAAGAWSNGVLERSGIMKPDLILRKCIVFEYDGELVPGLTTCLDVRRHDGTDQDVTLVPFDGKTLAAGTGFTEVTAGDDGQEPDPLEPERLTEQLVQCFPSLAGRQPRILTCTKTEKRPGGKPNVNPQVYGADFHGVGGLAVAIPGKASFLFDLAGQVVMEIERQALQL